MDNKAEQNRCIAEEAARALRKSGWVVCPHGDEGGTWQIGDAIFSDDGLIKFAAWAPNSGPAGWTGSRAASKLRNQAGPLDAIEALDCIRAVIGVVRHPSGEDEAAAFRLIQAIVRKAPRTGDDRPRDG